MALDCRLLATLTDRQHHPNVLSARFIVVDPSSSLLLTVNVRRVNELAASDAQGNALVRDALPRRVTK